MYSTGLIILSLALAEAFPTPSSHPSRLDNPTYGPVAGESLYYSNDRSASDPFPANVSSGAILPTTNGPPDPDDELFQNLLSAEWAVYSFYQQGAEFFNASDFTAAGYPNTTFDRILEIRDNEAGHLRIFQDSISNNSIKPGPCKYDFGFEHNPRSYLAFGTLLEINSMAFLTGLVQQAQKNTTKAALTAIGQTETRHEVWHLMDIWKTSPFAGPADTVFPYANQILDFTNLFILPGSCPKDNPSYPYPSQKLPQVTVNSTTSTLQPGSDLTVEYVNKTHVPDFVKGKDYFAVFFHGVETVSAPFNVKTNATVIPKVLDQQGVFIVVIADKEGAPTEESVVAGPLFIMEQPVAINAYA